MKTLSIQEALEVQDPSGKVVKISDLVKAKDFASELEIFEVPHRQVGLHYVDEQFQEVLQEGVHAFWKAAGEHRLEWYDTAVPEIPKEVSGGILGRLSPMICKKVEIAPHEKGILYLDHRLERVLDSGVYYFWEGDVRVDCPIVDTRLLEINLPGQSIITADKVELRVNFFCSYKITDVVKVHTEMENFFGQLYAFLQLTLREYIGRHRLDELLENKERIAGFVLEKLREKEQQYFVEFREAGLKDIILPGDIKDIMNTVLMAEKEAQAKSIVRREEVASTRSLLNTAKLMDENKTLYRLKEMEYIEKICENIGSISLNAGNDILSNLRQLFVGEGAK